MGPGAVGHGETTLKIERVFTDGPPCVRCAELLDVAEDGPASYGRVEPPTPVAVEPEAETGWAVERNTQE